ncbi:glycosyltransferase family 4 protein [Natroniella acetigena]|uniref:glycosyltransferase family 4 protein n=1 Tax=Natroniella acetigena TaxID=52004 RepID=UPI00200B0805|nr:glycosyltransferase family 4 protein [Natroniella acetigena]MCK8828049.1 glycosyltransferase family 4 protein [Natroniella acetigena]
MKILVLSWEYPPYSKGGLASHLYDLLPELSKVGIEIYLVTQGTEDTPQYEQKNGIHVYRVYTPKISTPDFSSWVMLLNYKLLEKAISVVNNNQIDLIHSHDWLVTFASQTLKHTYALPLVTTIHATEVGRNHGIHNEEQKYINDIEWWTTYEAWEVICCSDYMKSEVTGHFSLPQDKVKVIRNGVKEENFSAQYDGNFRTNFAHPEENIVFFIGRLVQEKGVQVLLEAVPQILKYSPQTKFIIAGNGPKEDDLKSQARRLGIAQHVYFTGYAREKLRNSLYQIADVAVFPSLYEPFGIVALEAMITKTPLVGSDVGGLGEIIEHRRNGLKTYPDDSKSLASNILKILYDEALTKNMVANAYQEAKEDYNWTSIAEQTVEVYRGVLAEYETSDWDEEEIVM